MVDRGDYFCINRGRQYGKTTTLNSLKAGGLLNRYTGRSFFKKIPDENNTGDFISDLCVASDKPVVVIIDEVDQAGNYDSL